MNRLAQALSIRPGESRMEALFFARCGIEYLPYMFIGLGFTSMSVSVEVPAALGKEILNFAETVT